MLWSGFFLRKKLDQTKVAEKVASVLSAADLLGLGNAGGSIHKRIREQVVYLLRHPMTTIVSVASHLVESDSFGTTLSHHLTKVLNRRGQVRRAKIAIGLLQ